MKILILSLVLISYSSHALAVQCETYCIPNSNDCSTICQ